MNLVNLLINHLYIVSCKHAYECMIAVAMSNIADIWTSSQNSCGLLCWEEVESFLALHSLLGERIIGGEAG